DGVDVVHRIGLAVITAELAALEEEGLVEAPVQACIDPVRPERSPCAGDRHAGGLAGTGLGVVALVGRALEQVVLAVWPGNCRVHCLSLLASVCPALQRTGRRTVSHLTEIGAPPGLACVSMPSSGNVTQRQERA